MAAFGDDNLKEEEKYGGFDPNSPEDESFSLENKDEYPGELPDFSEDITPDEAQEPEGEVSKAQKLDVPNEGSVWDLFDEDENRVEAPADDTPGMAEPDISMETELPDEELLPDESDIPDDIDEIEVPEEDEIEVPEMDEIEIPEEPENLEEETPIGVEDTQPEDISPDAASDSGGPDLTDEESTAENPESDDNDDLAGLAAQIDSQARTMDQITGDMEESINQLADVGNKTEVPEDVSSQQDEAETGGGRGFSLAELEDEEVEVDESLKELLRQDLNKSKKKRSDRMENLGARVAGESEMTEEEHEEKLKGFMPVGDDEAEQIINLNSFKARHPSTAGLKDASEMPLADDDSEPDVKPAKTKKKEKKSKNEKKPDKIVPSEDENSDEKKKVFPWGSIATVAASLVLISLLTYGTYYIYSEWDWFTGLLKSDSSKMIENIAAENGTENIQHVDENKEIAKNEPAPEETPVQTAIKNEPVKQESMKEITTPRKVKPVIRKHDIVRQEKQVHNSRTVPVRSYTEKDVASIDKNESLPPLLDAKNIKDEPGVYTVEIYSTPSLEDAQEWLGKLKRKKVENAFIVAHKKRDKNWYRVRFGNFRSREEAKKEALKLGFAQTWIDRVR